MDGAKPIPDTLEHENVGRKVLDVDGSSLLRVGGLHPNKDPGASKNISGENPLRLKDKGFLALIINQELVEA